MSETNAIGIDLGTNSSSVGVVRDGKIAIIVNQHGNRSTPSNVAFTKDGLLVGEAAENQMDQNGTNTVFATKRLLGRKFTDRVVQANMKHWPFKVIAGEGGKPLVQVEFKGETKTFAPEEITAMILTKMKQTAEAFLGHPVKDAVISVPANFNDAQRQATKDAGAIAGLNVLRIMNESSLAAHAYGLDKKGEGECNAVVVDLGGGTLDVSVIGVKDGVFDVKSVAGSTELGGEDFTNRLVHHFAAEFKKKHKKNMASDQAAKRRLRSACEKLKITLSTSSQAALEVDSLFDGIDFYSNITRRKFDEICEDLLKVTEEAVETALSGANLDKSDVDEAVLIGGASKIPKVETMLSEVLPETPINKSVDPVHAVVFGATVQAAVLSGDTCEAVGGGNIQVYDVVPNSLGIELIDDWMAVIIPRNTRVPTTMSNRFTTCWDNQTSCQIKVFEGEAKLTTDNNLLGEFELTDIQIAPEGVPQIEVEYAVDAEGILQVSAKDLSTGSQDEITITSNKGRLSKEEIKKMTAAMSDTTI